MTEVHISLWPVDKVGRRRGPGLAHGIGHSTCSSSIQLAQMCPLSASPVSWLASGFGAGTTGSYRAWHTDPEPDWPGLAHRRGLCQSYRVEALRESLETCLASKARVWGVEAGRPHGPGAPWRGESAPLLISRHICLHVLISLDSPTLPWSPSLQAHPPCPVKPLVCDKAHSPAALPHTPLQKLGSLDFGARSQLHFGTPGAFGAQPWLPHPSPQHLYPSTSPANSPSA